jgi:hypothetical protein
VDAIVYSLIQVVHNLNAAFLLAIPASWLWHRPSDPPSSATTATLVALWAVQGLTGAGFGGASLAFYGALPDLHPAGLAALIVKMGCVVVATGWCVALLIGWKPAARASWLALAALAGVALSAAAVLRWAS